MATLNSSYQYIGRTSGVSCASGWNYYVLLYAKTTGDISTGKHTVSVKMRLVCDRASTFYSYYTDGSVKVNGVNAIYWLGKQVPNTAWNTTPITEGGVTYPRWIDLKEGTVVVDTGFGEAKDVEITAAWQRNAINGTPPNWLPYTTVISANIPVTLPMIASASTILSAPDVTVGGNCNVVWVPAAASLRYRLKFSVVDWSYTTDPIHPNRTDSYKYTGYTFPIEVANHFVTKAGEMTVTLYTYSDSEATIQIGSEHTAHIHITVPETEETKPTVTMSLSPVSMLNAPFDSLYIQGKSKVQAALEFNLKCGAIKEDSNITVDGTVYGDPYESGYLTKSGVITVKGSVKDSREHYGTAEQDITVIPYRKPIVQAASWENNIVAARCDADGNITEKGTYLKIKAKLVYEKVIVDGTQNNFGKIQYCYREVGGSWSEWVTILDTANTTSTEVTTEPLLNGALNVKSNYQVQIRAIDNLESPEPIMLSVPSENVYMDRPAYGNGMGLGGYTQGTGNLDVYWKIKARGGLSLFNKDGEEISDDRLPIPCGIWNTDSIADGVYEVSEYPLMDSSHPDELIMETGVLVQMSATVSGDVKLQLAFPADGNSAAYRTRWSNHWTDWIYI